VTANRIAAAAVIAVAAVLFALTFGFERLPAGLVGGFGAEAFPRLVLGTIMMLALLLALVPQSAEPQPPIPRMVYFSGAALFLFMALVPLVGMLPAMFLFLVGLGYLWGERRPWVLLACAIPLTAAIWAVFAKGFGIPLPQGLFS
jgi:putative tricarboxylic transport membrane protein